MLVSLAQEKQLTAIFELYQNAIAHLERNKIQQWDAEYPSLATLHEDIKNKELFVGEVDGEIVCSYVLNQVCDAEYASGKWTHAHAEFYVIHRLCVHPQHQNRGVAKTAMQYIETQVKTLGAESIRLDAFARNPYSLKLYEALGYRNVGLVHWRKGEFFLMEKQL